MSKLKKLYYNPTEAPNLARFISKEKSIDLTFTPNNTPDGYPFYFDEMFSALKRGDFDDIIITITAHQGCYYPRKLQDYWYERIPVTGEISLLDYIDGGGYLKDKHIYH